MNKMLDKMCNWVDSSNGKKVMAVAVLAGGLHLALTESQPVLNFLDLPSFGWFSAQHILGVVLTVGGLCCLKNCM